MKGHDDKYRIENNITFIAGVDEAGRGPLAGPVVAAAVILNPKVNLLLVDDSKKLSKKKRELALNEIKDNSLAISIGIASPEEIDKLNILEATKLAMIRALNNLTIKPELVLIDHVKINYHLKTISITKGDQLSLSIAAASIVAKTYRDNLMDEYHTKYPEYGFNKHAGYPTKKHLDAIKLHGITPIHRKTFKPIKEMIKKY